MPLTVLSLVPATRRVTGAGQHARHFLDVVFDSVPLYPIVLAAGVDNITPIWMDSGEYTRTAIRRLLGEAEPDAPGGRVSVYVCAECADLGCGAITVVVERDDAVVTWRDWGYQTDYDDDVARFAGLDDATFDAAQYDAVLRAALDGITGEQERHRTNG